MLHEQKRRFLNNAAKSSPWTDYLAHSFISTLQRNRTYRDKNISNNQRDEFRRSFRRGLKNIVDERYLDQAGVGEDTHISNILDFRKKMTSSHHDILFEQKFRIGPAQKALNLYLKYLWCEGKISTPPHFPLDRSVIQRLSKANRTICLVAVSCG